jgi:archaellum biogenesis ATPase FlaH
MSNGGNGKSTETIEAGPRFRSYRDIVLAHNSGEEVSLIQMELWRREEELLCAALRHGKKFLGTRITPAYFTAPLHRIAWEALLQIISEDPDVEHIDGALLVSTIRSLDQEELVGIRGDIWLDGVLAEDPLEFDDCMNTTVRELTQSHWNRIWGGRFGRLIEESQEDPNQARVQVEYLRAANSMALEIESQYYTTEATFNKFAWNPFERETSNRVTTGLDFVDNASAGGHGRGELMVIGGGTGDGKTYVVLSMACEIARRGNRVLVIETEDSGELCYCRSVARLCDPLIAPAEMVKKKADPHVVQLAQKRFEAEVEDRLWVHPMKKPSISDVCQCMRHYRYTKGVDVVIVDYLQAVTGDDGPADVGNRPQEVSAAVSSLKKTADQLHVALILTSQYAREHYKDGKEPGLTACKYSGDIENESEIMLLLWRDAQDVLHAKLAKCKWARAKHLRYIVHVDETTGWPGEFEQDMTESAS